jgi:hypothetical protein
VLLKWRCHKGQRQSGYKQHCAGKGKTHSDVIEACPSNANCGR